MPKFTRRIRRNRKNRTFKSGGDGIGEERKGILDIASDKISDATYVIADKAEDIALNALGLERKNEVNPSTHMVGENIENTASNVVTNVGNALDKTSIGVLDNINEVLGSQVVSEGVKQAAKETAEITGKLAETFNTAMDNPIVKEQVERAIEHASEIGEVFVKSSEKPLQEAAKVGVEAGTKALGAASAGIVKVGTDMMAAVPGVGAIIEVGKILNDGSKAASAVVEAGTEAISTASDAFVETNENVKQGLKELEEKKKMAEQIANRTTKSINQFENPIPSTKSMVGGRKTKRRLFKRKAKSKRVKFAI